MILVLEIAGGILLGLWLWHLPAIFRRKKVRNWYLNLSAEDAFDELLRPNAYTKDQRDLLTQLTFAKGDEKREVASRLANSFPDK